MQFLSLIVKQKKRKHQAQKKKSDSSQAKKCRLLHKSIMGDCYKIFWTKTSVPYLMRSEATQRANGSVKQTNSPKTKTWNEQECLGRVAGYSLIWVAPVPQPPRPIQSLVPIASPSEVKGNDLTWWDKLVMQTKSFMMRVCENSHSILLSALSELTAMIDTAF